MRLLAAVVLVAGLTACSQSAPHTPTPAQAWALAPPDPKLAALYGESCKACHAVPGTGAPLVHDRKAWDPRWKQGQAVLLDHAVQGFRSMPAGGQCAACTPNDFNALIRFMAGREDSAG